MTCPRYKPEELREHLNSLHRGPFRELLARFLECGPSEEAITEQAEKHPDRWAQSLAIVARLGGFNEKLEVEGTLTHKVADMSDLELKIRIEALASQLGNSETP